MTEGLIGFEIPGWFKENECYKLYQLAKDTDGPILEIGHFLGRSTSFICQGIRDSTQEKKFKSYDLGFTDYNEVQKFYFEMYGSNVKIPKLYDIAFSKNTTTSEIAKINLQELKLDSYVELISGNFINIDQDKYKFIFCDAMHDQIEIKNNLPHIISHSNENDCIWAFHDTQPEYVDFILENSNCEFIELVNTLGIFRIKS
jgi:hypothetical protein